MSKPTPILPAEEPSVRAKTLAGNRNPDWLGTIDQFAVLHKLGSGGYGTVYLAQDTFTGVKYALKTILPELKSSPEELERLKEKFTLVQRLRHPNIAGAYVIHLARDVDLATEDVARDLHLAPGDPVMIMHYAPGETLSAWRRRFAGGRVPVEKAIEVCRQIADALDYAHRQGIVHRDIKPGNVVVNEKNGAVDVQVLDFGLAEQIRTSLSRTSRARIDTSGTRPYMAPEQWTGRDQDGRTDQYALAVVLYELLSGDVPFGYAFSTGDVAIMEHKVLHEPVLSLNDLSETQNRILRKALSKEPADRFRTCRAFLGAFAGRTSSIDEGADSDSEKRFDEGDPRSFGDALRRSLRMLLPFLRAALRRVWDLLRPVLDRLLDALASTPLGRCIHRRAPAPRTTAPATQKSGGGYSSSVPLPPPTITPVDLGDGLTFEMSELRPGDYSMGSPHSEPGRRPGETLHKVQITNPFQLAAAPVTRGKWRAIMQREPPGHAGDDELPVTNVSWDDVHTFLDVLNARHAIRGYEWRLPTEAQWEYACRAGSTGPYAGTGRIDDMAWYAGNSGSAIHPVRQKKPNAWGLYDMHGNVWEWCEDAWSDSLGRDDKTDPFVAGTDRERVARGGSWNHSAALCRSACRMKMPRSARFDNLGFRVALVPR